MLRGVYASVLCNDRPPLRPGFSRALAPGFPRHLGVLAVLPVEYALAFPRPIASRHFLRISDERLDYWRESVAITTR